tara:strand:+ start:1677 stop:2018 length:342 start_codon:yes stop_codon:yes gene_type:complete
VPLPGNSTLTTKTREQLEDGLQDGLISQRSNFGSKLGKGDIVEVTWTDSHAIYGWHELEDLTPSIIVSAGYVLKDEDDYLVLVSSNSDSGNHFTALSIPRGCINDAVVLKRAT